MNHNVLLTYIWTWFETLSSTLRSGDVLSAYMFLRWESKSLVGYVQGITGIVQMLVAFPAGWLSDRSRRDTTIRIAAAIGLLSLVLMALDLQRNWPAWCFSLSLALMGVYRGFNNPSIESIFADSVQTAHRAVPFTTKFIIQNVASSAGPLLNVGFFWLMGNKWALADCRDLLLIGLVTMLPPIAIMWWFDDDKSLGSSSEAICRPASTASIVSSLLPMALRKRSVGRALGAIDEAWLVPFLISSSDFISALASGMTIKFFPLFFLEQCGLKPMSQQLLSALSPLCISLASAAAQRLSKSIGRVATSIASRLLDVALLVGMAYYPVQQRALLPLLLAIHLTRSASANCARPLMRSVMMEFVPKKRRAKWAAADSVRSFSWSGSAALGGILIELYGYQTTFLVTAAVKFLSWLPLWLLLFMVPDSPCWAPPGMTIPPSSAVVGEESPSEVDLDDEDGAIVEPFDETYDDREPREAAGDEADALLQGEVHRDELQVHRDECYPFPVPPRRSNRHVSFSADKDYILEREEM